MSKTSWKDQVNKVAGKEPDPVVYDFRAPAGRGNTNKKRRPGQFKVRANEQGTGFYDGEN
jgi:hypothetical protein